MERKMWGSWEWVCGDKCVCVSVRTSKPCSERCLGWSRLDGCSGALGSRFLVPKPLEEKAAGLCVPVSECSQSICHQIQGLV